MAILIAANREVPMTLALFGAVLNSIGTNRFSTMINESPQTVKS